MFSAELGFIGLVKLIGILNLAHLFFSKQ